VKAGAQAPTSVTLFDQGLADVLEASVAGLQPMQPYVLALSERADGSGKLELLKASQATRLVRRSSTLSGRSARSSRAPWTCPAATWSSHQAR
jgi:hypothetical protein